MSSTSAKFKAVAAVLAALACIGLGVYAYQLINGLAVTSMSDGTSWGLYITNFMFFVGLSAGGLIVASSAHVFHIESFKRVALPAVILSTVCICCAGMFIFIDLGGIQRIWRMFIGLNLTSPLAWDMIIITCYLAINILDIVWIVQGKERNVQMLSWIALPVAILVHSVTAWIFGLEIAREGWYSAIMAPLFVASAMDSGLGLLLLVLFGSKKAGWLNLETDLIAKLARLLSVCIAIDGFMVLSEVLTMGYPGASGAETLSIMVTGPMAPFFWIEVFLGIVAPFVLLVPAGNCRKPAIVGVAAACVVVGVFCKRVWLLLTSFAGLAMETSTGTIGSVEKWMQTSFYFPTVFEFAIVVGIISLGTLGFMVLGEKLIAPPAESASAATDAAAVSTAK